MTTRLFLFSAKYLIANLSFVFRRAVLGNRSLRSLVLPGTHNAGSYSLADDNDVVASWVVCQDEDILSQLLYGNRYLDLRVGYYPETRELLWINHDLVRWRPLQDVLDAVRGFLALSPDPLIIDIHRTPVGFQLPESLELMLSLMNTTLGSHFVHNRHGPHVTLDDLWQMGKRVVFTFIDPTVSDHTPWVWPPLPQAWANAQLVDDLRTFLDAEMNMRFESPRLWAAMAHLTPSLWDLLFRSHIGVRGLADRVNFSITRWLRQRWGHMANIVASDFFRGNNIINVAIRTNLALSMCRPSDPSRHPYTLRWTTELALRSGSPSTTIPPFVRRMYSGGTMWSTTGVHRIQYPFIPIDANISKVFTAIPNRIPSEAPGVTYQDNGDSWHKIFHYPTDGPPQPPVSTTSRSHSQPSSSTTSPSVAVKSSPTANVETDMANWDDVDSQDFLDEAFPNGVNENAPIIATELPLPLPREFGNIELESDVFNNTSTLLSTNNRTLIQNQPIHLDKGVKFGIDNGNLKNESTSSPGNIEKTNESLLLMNNDTLSDSLSIINNTDSSPLSTIIIPTQDNYDLPVNTTLQNSLQVTNKSTDDESYLLVGDDMKSIKNSSSVYDDALMVSTPVRMLFGQSQTNQSTNKGVTRRVWHSDSDAAGTESINDLSESDLLVLPQHQTLEHSSEQLQLPKPSTKVVGTHTLTKYSSVSDVQSQAVVKEQASAPTITVYPGTSILNSQSGVATIKVQPTTSTATTPIEVVELTGTKSSSQVT
ncbi:PI-PLC X domain-containing protein 1 [Portunus trituberculatus]|uniref:PI-PLC X domain-containing protein 1 n=1 Tax=Portunus trituberculatus TaxID=210409 RepID=A0A5B7GEX0_PORTR|nr:PI-PLC X domain-containing protein 1 [Portunus trituberculatus]